MGKDLPFNRRFNALAGRPAIDVSRRVYPYSFHALAKALKLRS